MYTKVIQLHIDMYLFFFKFFSPLSYIILSRACAYRVGPVWLCLLNIAVVGGIAGEFGTNMQIVFVRLNPNRMLGKGKFGDGSGSQSSSV